MAYRTVLTSRSNEKKRASLFCLGLIAACSLTLTAFEWRISDETHSFSSLQGEEIHLIESDLQPVIILEASKPFNTAKSKRTSNHQTPVKLADEHLSRLTSSTPAMALNSPSRILSPTLSIHATESNSPREWNELKSHELPYFLDCSAISDSELRFQCTQDRFQSLIESNFSFLNIGSRSEYPEHLFVSFVVDEYGSIGNIKYSQKLDKSLDMEIRRVFAEMPLMYPGKVNGRGVRIQFAIPFHLSKKN